MLNVLLCVSSSTRRLRVCCWWPRWPCRSSARRRKRSASTHIHKQQIHVLLMLKWRSAGGINISADQSFCDYKCCCIFNCTSRHKHYITLYCTSKSSILVTCFDASAGLSSCPMGSCWVWLALTSPWWRWWSWHPDTWWAQACGGADHGNVWIISTQYPVFDSD